MNIIINKCYGGFTVNEKAKDTLDTIINGDRTVDVVMLGNKAVGIASDNEYAYRASPELFELIKILGIDNCHGKYSEWKIVTIPDDVDWTIEEYDGLEWISEVHRTWS